MALEHGGFRGIGRALDQGVRDTIEAGKTTGDLGGKLNTVEFTDAVLEATKRRLTGE